MWARNYRSKGEFMIYLASPYSGTLEVMQQRYEKVLHATATFLTNKVWVYSPIVHCHEQAVRYNMPRDAAFWRAYNKHVIEHGTGVWVLQIPGWEASKGVTDEIGMAKELDKPLCYVSMDHEKVVVWQAGEYGGGPVCEYALIR